MLKAHPAMQSLHQIRLGVQLTLGGSHEPDGAKLIEVRVFGPEPAVFAGKTRLDGYGGSLAIHFKKWQGKLKTTTLIIREAHRPINELPNTALVGLDDPTGQPLDHRSDVHPAS